MSSRVFENKNKPYEWLFVLHTTHRTQNYALKKCLDNVECKTVHIDSLWEWQSIKYKTKSNKVVRKQQQVLQNRLPSEMGSESKFFSLLIFFPDFRGEFHVRKLKFFHSFQFFMIFPYRQTLRWEILSFIYATVPQAINIMSSV